MISEISAFEGVCALASMLVNNTLTYRKYAKKMN